jgi:hypothetical protein
MYLTHPSLAKLANRHSPETIERMRLVKLGGKNPIWADDNVGINALHGWINSNRAKPRSGYCPIIRCRKHYWDIQQGFRELEICLRVMPSET